MRPRSSTLAALCALMLGAFHGVPVPAADLGVGPILKAGFAEGRTTIQQAENAWKRARRSSPQDARVDFAWGLVLLKGHRFREAERMLHSAANKSGPGCPRAKRALAWLTLSQGEYAQGLDILDEMVREVAAKRPAAEKSARTETAEWIGRSLAALHKLPLSREDESRRRAVVAGAERRFSGDLLVALDEARRAIEKRHQELQLERLKTRLAAEKRLRQKKATQGKRIREQKADVKDTRKSLKLSAEQWDEWLKKQEKSTRTAVKRLSQKMDALEKRRRAISRSYWLTIGQRTMLATATQPPRQGQRAPGAPPTGTDLAFSMVDRELARYLLSYNATTAEMNRLQSAAALLVRRYRSAEKKYHDATGRIARKNATIARFEARLKSQAKKLKASRIDGTLAAKLMQRRLKSFATYVPFDANVEKQKLLESFHSKTN